MPHIHGTWGHYVRPGKTDGYRYGSQRFGGRHDSGDVGISHYHVYDLRGRSLYSYTAGSSDKLLKFLKKCLPETATKTVAEGIKLTRSLHSLGFESREEFTSWCKDGMRGKQRIIRKKTARKTKGQTSLTTSASGYGVNGIKQESQGSNGKKQRHKPKMKGNMFYVVDRERRRLYQCMLWRSEGVRKRIRDTLPDDSYAIKGNVVILKKSLEALGFGSTQDFTQWCSKAVKQ